MHGEPGDGCAQDSLGKPYGDPCLRCSLPLGEQRGCQSRASHHRLPPPRNCREGAGTLYGLADEAQIFQCGVLPVERRLGTRQRAGTRAAAGLGIGHRDSVAAPFLAVKYFAMQRRISPRVSGRECPSHAQAVPFTKRAGTADKSARPTRSQGGGQECPPHKLTGCSVSYRTPVAAAVVQGSGLSSTCGSRWPSLLWLLPASTARPRE